MTRPVGCDAGAQPGHRASNWHGWGTAAAGSCRQSGHQLNASKCGPQARGQDLLLDPQPRNGPGDHELLDLLGALEDVLCLPQEPKSRLSGAQFEPEEVSASGAGCAPVSLGPASIAVLYRRRTGRHMTPTGPNGATAASDQDSCSCECGGALPDRAWQIGDIAAAMDRSENTARKFVRLPDAPAPFYEDGAGGLWDPRAVWAWIEARSAAATQAKVRAAEAQGRQTRV